MKKVVFYMHVFLTVTVLLLSCNSTSEEIGDFKNSNEKVISMFHDKNTAQDIFLSTTPKKELYAISVMKNEELIVVAYYSEANGRYTLYHLDGIQKIEGKLDKVISDINKENNLFELPSSIKVNYSRAKGCIGGSTWGCIKYALKACNKDTICSLVCRAAGWNCPASIAIACSVHCNN